MKKIQNILKFIGPVIITVFVGVSISYAGTLTPPGAPSSTSYTLGDIYTRLTTNARATDGNHSLSTSTIPASTFHSVTEIYNAIPTIDATKVLTGTTYLGVAGTASAGYTYPSAPLKTEQTICYDASGSVVSCSGTGQDGDTQTGVSESYTDNGDGTIKDNSTGLTWQKQDNGTAYTWENALAYCNSNTAGLPGSGWRLPNVRELLSIVDYANASPAINSTYFPSTQSSYYWSATTYQGPGYQNYAWNVYFGDGVENGNLKSVGLYDRCVRG